MRIILVVASVLVLSQADDDTFSVEKKSKHYCGKELRLVLKFICDSIYKRSSPDTTPMREDWVMNFIRLDEPKTDYPFRSRAEALTVLPEYFRRPTRGVADECCTKPCTIDELKTYCGEKSS